MTPTPHDHVMRAASLISNAAASRGQWHPFVAGQHRDAIRDLKEAGKEVRAALKQMKGKK